MNEKETRTVTNRRKSAPLRRQELVQAGITCLGKGGMAAFTVDQICRQAGVSRGLINHHFTSKDELLLSIYDEMTQHLVQVLQHSESDRQLAEILDNSFDEKSINPANLRAWLSIWGMVGSNDALNNLHQDRYRRYHARISQLIASITGSAHRQNDVDSIARQLVALIDGLWLEYCLHSDELSLATAKRDCYRFLENCGVILDNPHH